jgi:CubicO group peptidase (beta-lactamase class C family)
MATIDLAAVDAAAQSLFAPDAPHGVSLALVVMQSGQVVFERYGRQPDTVFGPGSPVAAESTLISWSMAKSITHAAVGVLVGEGRLQLDEPAPVEAWKGTPKEAITLQHLLNMRPGLEFVEDYVDDTVSHCIEMLYGSGQHDMAAYAASLPLLHEPGSFWNYSSGTTNIVSRIVGDAVGGGRAGMEAFLRTRLFEPCGMRSAVPKFDEAGTFVGSSFVYATARDFARFGEMYRNDGMVGTTRVVPAGWAAHAATFTELDTTTGFAYGAHWWLWPDFAGSLACHGYEGQYTVVLPSAELVVVHLGKCPAEQRSIVNDHLRTILRAAQ